MPHGSFVWRELYTRDVEAAKAFYGALLGWTFEGVPMPDNNQTYWLARSGEAPVAGILDMRGMLPEILSATLVELSRDRRHRSASRRNSSTWRQDRAAAVSHPKRGAHRDRRGSDRRVYRLDDARALIGASSEWVASVSRNA